MSACFLYKIGINQIVWGDDNEEVLYMIVRILVVCIVMIAVGCVIYWGYMPETSEPILRATAV